VNETPRADETAVEPNLIVGIGVPAGGLEPLERFFAAMPADTGMAFVVLQHLSPDFESRMDELLGRQTRMPILNVTDGTQVEPNRIYLIPPRKEMIVAGGRLLLTGKDETRGLSLPIDHFFRSLAHESGRRAVAIVLSGAGSDGSRGIREIHDAGGLVLWQVLEAARFQGMPLPVKQTGVVDVFLPPEEMPAAIVRYLNDPARPWDERWQANPAMEEIVAPGTPAARPPFPGECTVPGPQLIGVYDQLLARAMPASVLVDEHYQLVHSFGGAEQLLHVRPGRPSNNVLDMVEESLKPALLGALQDAHEERKAVRLSGVPVKTPEGSREYRLTVDPLQSAVPHFLISFESRTPAQAPAEPPASLDAPAVSRDYLSALENDLRFTKESLQATIEELETANEELHTVNVEHQRKISQLAELTDDLDGLLHGIDVGVLFLDEALCIRKYTAQAARVFRLLPEHVGRRFDGFAPTIQHPGLESDVLQVLQTGQPIQREVTSPDGIIYLLRILPHRSHTAKNAVVVLLVDISELRRSEAHVRRLSAIVESGGDAIFAKDASGKISGWNRGAETLYGWSAEEAMTREWLFMVAPDKRDEAAGKLAQAEDGQVMPPYETVHLRKDGSPVDVSISHSPIYDEHDRMIGASSLARDVTQKKRDEAEVRRALHLRDQFMAMLSHELRNPLAALLNAAALLEKSNGNGDAQKTQRALQTIGRQCRHMARLLDDLLDVSRMRQDDVELRRTNLDLRGTVEAALERVRPMADAAEVAVSVELPIDPVEVYGDADRLQQIEVNLLTNAIKYTPAGRRVRLSLAREAGEAVLRVADDGAGIPPHMLERIFEPFVRAVDDFNGNGGNGKRYGGMGLGLALVRSFVRAHGGEVGARSGGLGQGAEFLVRLPLAKGIGRPAPLEGGPAHGSGESLVLVEDQEDNRIQLADILTDAGYVVLPAADGKQAIELIEREKPAVAVVDIGLPEVSGYDVARDVRMRLQRMDMFLVALTGYGQQQDREAVLQAGFDQHLVKPVDITTLLDVLRARKSLRGSAQWASAAAQAVTDGRI
jgi:two-component system CheB/CheR fusion protein